MIRFSRKVTEIGSMRRGAGDADNKKEQKNRALVWSVV